MKGEQLTPLDETLLKRRAVIAAQPDPDGPGWTVELACGHTVWCAARPMNFTHCGKCLSVLAEQARAFTERQTRPKAE